MTVVARAASHASPPAPTPASDRLRAWTRPSQDYHPQTWADAFGDNFGFEGVLLYTASYKGG